MIPRTKTARGSMQRKAQRAIGAQTEASVERDLVVAKLRGTAYITKRPTSVRVLSVGAGGRVGGYFEKSPGVDYSGVLRDGRAVYLEVKSCHAGTFALREIELAQWDEMHEVARFGAVRALVVRWTPDSKRGRALLGRASAWCVVPWDVLLVARDVGDGSLSSETLVRHAIPEGESWVDALLVTEVA